MKRIVLAVLSVFFLAVCGTNTAYAETVIMDDYGVDYHLEDLITVYENYSIYGLRIVDSNNGDISHGLLAIDTSPDSYLAFIIVAFEDEKYLSFTIQGYWEGDGTIGYLSTNTVSDLAEVTLSIGEQRR